MKHEESGIYPEVENTVSIQTLQIRPAHKPTKDPGGYNLQAVNNTMNKVVKQALILALIRNAKKRISFAKNVSKTERDGKCHYRLLNKSGMS